MTPPPCSDSDHESRRAAIMYSEWHTPREHRSPSLAHDLAMPAELFGPSAHIGQPQSALSALARTKPAPVVGDLQQAFVIRHADSDAGLGGSGMTADVGDRLSDRGQKML